MTYLDVEKIFAAEAKERQGQRNDLNITEIIPECSKGRAAEKAVSFNAHGFFMRGVIFGGCYAALAGVFVCR